MVLIYFFKNSKDFYQVIVGKHRETDFSVTQTSKIKKNNKKRTKQNNNQLSQPFVDHSKLTKNFNGKMNAFFVRLTF